MTEEKDSSLNVFVAQAQETPDSRRVSLDEDEVQVVNEDDLPDSARSSGSTGGSLEESQKDVSVSGHSRDQMSQASPQVVEADLNTPDVIEAEYVIKRVYVDDPSEIPEGVDVSIGPRGGLYFEEEALEFRQMQLEVSQEEVFEQDEYDYSQEQIERAVQKAQEAREIANEAFGTWVGIAEDIGADIATAGHRTKSVGSALEKVHNREETQDDYDTVEDLTDWHGSMLQMGSTEEVHETFEAIQDQFPDEDIEYVNNHFDDPDSDPYRGYNLKVNMDGTTEELQIFAEDMAPIKTTSHSLLLKPDREAPVDEVDELPDDYDDDHPLATDIQDCLTQEADVLEGELDPDDVDCNPEAQSAIRAYLEYEGMGEQLE